MRMMTSVSILLRMIGAAIAESLLNGFGMSAPHRPHVGNGAGNRCGRRTCRARQMGPRAWPLPTDKIAIGRRDRTLSGSDRLTICGKAHRAARLAPLKSRLDEDLVQSFGDRIAFDVFRTWYDPGSHASRDFAAARDFSRCTQIA